MINAKELGKRCDMACLEIDKEIQIDVDKTCMEIETRMLNSIRKDPTKRFIKIGSGERFTAFLNARMRASIRRKFEELGFSWREIGDRGMGTNFEVTIGW